MNTADVLSIPLVFAGAGVMWFAASRIEPHRVGRSLTSFRGLARRVERNGTAERWRDAVTFVDGCEVEVRFRRTAHVTHRGRLASRVDGPNRRAYTYAVAGNPIIEVRVPRTSKMVPVLDELTR